MSDKSASLLFSKLKDAPQPPPISEILLEEEQQYPVNTMPLVQDVGLPTLDEMEQYEQNGEEVFQQQGKIDFKQWSILNQTENGTI